VSEVVVNGRRLPLPRALVKRAVLAVLEGERREALISVTFVGPDAMRRLNARHKGHDRPTDVLTFPLNDAAGRIIGDIYICPDVARDNARARDVAMREEIARLVVHGVLHVLGYDHPDGEERETSAMWRRQERLVRRVWPRSQR